MPGSQVNRHKALHEASEAKNKQLTARHQALIKEFEAHKKEAEAAIKGHQVVPPPLPPLAASCVIAGLKGLWLTGNFPLQAQIATLQDQLTKAQEEVATAKKKLADAQRDGWTFFGGWGGSCLFSLGGADVVRPGAEAAKKAAAALTALQGKYDALQKQYK